MKRKTTLLAALAIASVLGMGIAPAGAYFTDSSTANGGIPIGITPSTDFYEWYENGVKHLTVTNSADASSPVFVRARAYTSLPTTIAGSGWTAADDGWYYYGPAIAPGGTSEDLTVTIQFPTIRSTDEPNGAEIGDNYNIIVVYESTPAIYDAQGNPAPDWSYILDSGN